MASINLFEVCGAILFALGIWPVILHSNVFKKVIGINIAGSGAFLMMAAFANGSSNAIDSVPHALVITGLVVAVSATGLALALLLRLHEQTGTCDLVTKSDAEHKPE